MADRGVLCEILRDLLKEDKEEYDIAEFNYDCMMFSNFKLTNDEMQLVARYFMTRKPSKQLTASFVVDNL